MVRIDKDSRPLTLERVDNAKSCIPVSGMSCTWASVSVTQRRQIWVQYNNLKNEISAVHK